MSIVEKAIKKMGEQGAMQRPLDGKLPLAPKRTVANPVAKVPTKSIEVADRVRRSPEYNVPGNGRQRLKDEVRRIKRALLERINVNSTAQQRELLVTSSSPSEGKTFLALSIAQSVAQERDYGVLLVDGDLARPRLSGLFGLADAPGLTSLLNDRSLDPFDVIVETDIPGLWFLPAGPSSAHAPELVASARMRELLALIHGADPSRVVMFDSPPLLASNESQALSQLVNNILVVVRSQATDPSVVADALSTIPEGKTVSLVLNRIIRPRGFYGEYYSVAP